MTEEAGDNMQWFRWWHDGTTDPKLLRLHPQHRWLWIAVLTLASESPKRGYLYISEHLPCTVEEVARKANLPVSVAKAGLDLMLDPKFGMLDLDASGAWHVINWDKRQPKREDPTNAERQKRYRNALRNAQGNGGNNAPDTDTESDTDKNTPLTPQEGEREEYSSDFEAFWAQYPRKANKKGAFTKWKATLRKKGGPSAPDLIGAATRYAAVCQRKGTTQDYMLHAATFLGPQERWREYLVDEPVPETPTTFTPLASGEDVLARIRERKAGGMH